MISKERENIARRAFSLLTDFLNNKCDLYWMIIYNKYQSLSWKLHEICGCVNFSKHLGLSILTMGNGIFVTSKLNVTVFDLTQLSI